MSSGISNLRRIGLNSLAILGGDVCNKASTFLVYAFLARHAGVHEFGQLSLGLMLLYTFHVFAAAGLPTSLTRQVAKRPETAKRVLLHGLVGAMLPATIAVVGMVVFAYAMQYQGDTRKVIALLSLASMPYALTMVTEAVIKGRERMHLIAIGNVPGNVALVVGAYCVLKFGYGVTWLACVVITARTITMLFMFGLFCWDSKQLTWGSLRPRFSMLLLRHSLLFLGTDAVSAIWASLNGVLLSKFATESELGLLTASFQLMQPVLMFYRSVGHSSFPSLVTAAKDDSNAVGDLSRSLIGLLLRIAFPAALGAFVLAGDALATVYGNPAFRSGAIVLQILSFTLLLDPLNPILGHGLWGAGHEKTVFRFGIVNVLINAVASFFLIWRFGLIGAAVSAVLSSLVSTLLHYWYFQRDVAKLRLSAEVVAILPAALIAIVCVVVLPNQYYIGLLVAIAVYGFVTFIRMDRKLTLN